MKRSTRQAIVALVLLGGFAVVNAAFEKRVLEPMLGPEASAILAAIALGGALLASALLWAGMRRN